MEAGLHRFVRLLRLRGLRISTAEALDAFSAATAIGLTDRISLRAALSAALLKDRRDQEIFADTFDRFFGLIAVIPEDEHGHNHAHDDLTDTGELDRLTMSDEPSETPQEGHNHGKPADIRDYFDEKDLAAQYNLHQEANKIDMSSATEELVLSAESTGQQDAATRVELDVSRLSEAGLPGDLARGDGTTVDVSLSVAQQRALADWLDDPSEDIDPDLAAALRSQLSGIIENLPELLRSHLERLAALERTAVEETELRKAPVERIGEAERAHIEQSLRRLADTLHGGLTHRKRQATRGRIDVGRTMRRNLRYDGIPFFPVTTKLAQDRPRLVVVTDVSLSVRATARFTLHMVHALQNLFGQVRTFAFVADLVEITDLFAEHPLEHALGLVFGGDVLDVDANSDYGLMLSKLNTEFSSALTRRSTLVILGDGRGNGNEPRLDVFAELTRRVRETIWLTPEPRYSWPLGSCDLPLYAEHCDRVEVIRDLSGLSAWSEQIAQGAPT